jgi:hypothetical protein
VIDVQFEFLGFEFQEEVECGPAEQRKKRNPEVLLAAG